MNYLNFGCGTDIKEGWDNVDMQEGEGIQQSFDFDKFPYPLKQNHFAYVELKQVIEHVLYPDKVLMELHKSCKNGALIHIETAHYTNRGAYDDMQHQHFFNDKAFRNFVESHTLITHRKFKIKELKIAPTLVGKFIPKQLRNKLSLFINGLHSQIHCTYEVIK